MPRRLKITSSGSIPVDVQSHDRNPRPDRELPDILPAASCHTASLRCPGYESGGHAGSPDKIGEMIKKEVAVILPQKAAAGIVPANGFVKRLLVVLRAPGGRDAIPAEASTGKPPYRTVSG